MIQEMLSQELRRIHSQHFGREAGFHICHCHHNNVSYFDCHQGMECAFRHLSDLGAYIRNLPNNQGLTSIPNLVVNWLIHVPDPERIAQCCAEIITTLIVNGRLSSWDPLLTAYIETPHTSVKDIVIDVLYNYIVDNNREAVGGRRRIAHLAPGFANRLKDHIIVECCNEEYGDVWNRDRLKRKISILYNTYENRDDAHSILIEVQRRVLQECPHGACYDLVQSFLAGNFYRPFRPDAFELPSNGSE